LARKLRARDAEVLVLRHQLACTSAAAATEVPCRLGSDPRHASPLEHRAASGEQDAEATVGTPAPEPRPAPVKPPRSRPASAGVAARPAAGTTPRPDSAVELDRQWLVDTPLPPSAAGSSSRPLSATRPKTARPTSATTAPRQHQLGIYSAADVREEVLRPRSAHTPRSRQLKAALQVAASSGGSNRASSPRARPISASTRATW
jgi:hypothetical protein